MQDTINYAPSKLLNVHTHLVSTVKSQEYGVVMDTLGHTILYFKRYRYVLFTTALWGAGEGGRRGHEEDRGALTLAHGRQPRRVPLALRYVHELCASVSLSRASVSLSRARQVSPSLPGHRALPQAVIRKVKRENTLVTCHDTTTANGIKYPHPGGRPGRRSSDLISHHVGSTAAL